MAARKQPRRQRDTVGSLRGDLVESHRYTSFLQERLQQEEEQVRQLKARAGAYAAIIAGQPMEGLARLLRLDAAPTVDIADDEVPF